MPGDHKQGGPIRRDEAADWIPPGTSSINLQRRRDRHCPDCRCRCRCHRPPPEPTYTPWPTLPKPGEPFYLAAIAAGEITAEEWAA